MVEITGENALITGASRGIGRGIALALAEEGVRVGVNYPPFDGEQERATKIVETVRNNGGDAIAIEADVRKPTQVQEMTTSVEETFGSIDILVNNAGGSPETSPLVDMDVETWDQVLNLNLRGVFLTTKFALPGLLDENPGKIINIASQQGILGAANRVHYCAAKGGVIAFTRALARELAPDVQVNAIAPGPIVTNKRSDQEAFVERVSSTVPMGRAGQIEDVVPTAIFLASQQSDYYTGQTLSPDGGDAMH